MTELARRYYAWIGPATLAEFQTFSGLGVKASKAAVEPLKLEPLEKDSDRFLLLPGDREAFASFKPPKEAQYALVSWLDSVSLLRGDLKGMLEPADLARPYFHKKDARAGSSLGDVSNQAIVDRGRLVGLWEFDAAAERIVWWPFVKKNRDLETAVARTEEYVRQQLGDARGASLDSPKSRVPRLEALRNAALRQAPQK